MKKTIIAAAFCMAALAGFSQTDTTTVIINADTAKSGATADTIRIGSMVIIKKPGSSEDGDHKVRPYDWNKKRKNKRLQTSWLLLDLGYSNFNDKTDYTSQETLDFTGHAQPPFKSGDFSVRSGKSFDINVWLFRQRYGITKNNAFNLTYGFMIETTNFRFENDISFLKGSGPQYVKRDTIHFDKNKLATSYFTVPVMIGFNTNPKKTGFILNAGVSVGYMYSSRNKQISDERDKEKIKGNFNLQPWKVNFVAEAGIGFLKLYGSYAPSSMFKSGPDMRPYTIGIRMGGN